MFWSKLSYLYSLFIGSKTSRKIIVIESDDWGSERIPNVNVKDCLKEKGIDMYSNPHSKYDTLERLDDLLVLGELLKGIENQFEKKVKITTNFISANPDFGKIKANHFKSFYYESFNITYRNRDGNTRVLEEINGLINRGYIKPQYHGREHINAILWLKELENGNSAFLEAFNLNTYAIDASNGKSSRKNLMAALEYEDLVHMKFILNSIESGHEIFKSIFGFPSKTFIAPRYVWNPDLEYTFAKCGFTHLQTALFQQSPNQKDYTSIFHYTGQKSRNANIYYMARNVYFEPAYGKIDWVNNALQKIDLAFKFKTPAIISMHRINFVGGLDSKARDFHLEQFLILLKSIILKYPEVEFMTSDELAEIL
ncbi:hypothetical protein QWY31_13990 [Cytophagales bacterium LB-30]|uniref:Polysaccharide (De)acetylase n=2 Tax=Shiella aurantiaca TaxID=3058365 RepID=A0ABT8F8T2_9BACT|nr:hypothetical protein [Shiella aurantiaca]